MLSRFVSLIAFTLVVFKPIRGDPCEPKKTFHNLGRVDPPEDRFSSELLIDVYWPEPATEDPNGCHNFLRAPRGKNNFQRPFLIFACGAPAEKDKYSMFAHEMAKKGYIIAIMNKWLTIPQAGSLNAVTPVDFGRVVDFAKNHDDIDASKTVILGHSFGTAAVLSTLSEYCNGFFCGTGPPTGYYKVDLPPEIVAGAGYGGTVFPVGAAGSNIPDTTLTNMDQDGMVTPFFLLWGDGDSALIDADTTGTPKYLVSVEQFFSEKAYARDVQVKRVADAIDEWIRFQITDTDSDFCDELNMPIWRDDNNELACIFE